MHTDHGAFVSPSADRRAVVESAREMGFVSGDSVRYFESLAALRRAADEIYAWRPKYTHELASALRDRTDVEQLYAVKHPPSPYEAFADEFLTAASPPLIVVDAAGSWADSLNEVPTALSTARLNPAAAADLGPTLFGEDTWDRLPSAATNEVEAACRHLIDGDGSAAAAAAERAVDAVYDPDSESAESADGDTGDPRWHYDELSGFRERTETRGPVDPSADLTVQRGMATLFHARELLCAPDDGTGPA